MNRVKVVSCGPTVNESERKAIAQLKTRLISAQPDGEWLLLTNLPFSATHRLQSDEIDILAIGPPGVRVVEVKHWSAAWVRRNALLVEQAADLVTAKARKVGTTLRRRFPEVGRVDGAFLLTESATKTKGLESPVRGVPFHTLKTWRDALGYGAPSVLSTQQVRTLGGVLAPASRLATQGELRRLGGYTHLDLQTPPDERFHRVFKATHSSRRDRVILHLYDWSANDDTKAETKAQREFDALHRLQQYEWAPRIVDSFQQVPGYAGEIAFFTVVDPAAPSIAERASDRSWDAQARLAFARSAIRALQQLHESGDQDSPMLHRNVTPATVLVKHDNSPILTGLHHARIPADVTVASNAPEGWDPTTAPEVRAQGLAAADSRSDAYSMCASLMSLFEQADHEVVTALTQGMADDPRARSSLSDLSVTLARLLGEKIPTPPAPPVRFWTEEQIVSFDGHHYRIVSRLGSGGIGTTFKVVETDPATHEDLGAYVAKAVRNEETAESVTRAYRLALPHLRHPALSAIYGVASDWQDNGFSALMTWIEGEPLSEYIGLLPILAEDFDEASDEALAIRWLRTACSALDVLHRNGLVHGDVSPRNVIVCGTDIVLTDYDCVAKVGERGVVPGTVMYCSPSFVEGALAMPSDDIYALAASFFHVWFEKPPFQHGDMQAKDRGLNWSDIERDAYPVMASFLDRATDPKRGERYATVAEALIDLTGGQAEHTQRGEDDLTAAESADQAAANRTAASKNENVDGVKAHDAMEVRQANRIPWLKSLLQSYPGSLWGNSETRGLDTDFAEETYVETKLEQALHRDIVERRTSLVILCGNAGDGKTALLQHLAKRLGLGSHTSATRILEGHMSDGLTVRMNLDGSASWQGRSANELLDECLDPFREGPPQSSALLLAINDGRLLEWIEETEEQTGQTRLTKALTEQLEGMASCDQSHIRFINLNRRSLVGGVAKDGQTFDSSFLEQLVDSLYGGEHAKETWNPCRSCTAQDNCEVYRAACIFGPAAIAGRAPDVRSRARERLFEALQAVHLRGETHITVRELRATLVYILFGVRFCDEYHEGKTSETYADRAFSAKSFARQGEVLADLVRYDPGLETHPQVDRYLLQASTEDDNDAPRYPAVPLESARRRAYFEWTAENLYRVTEDEEALGLAQGRDLRRFRHLAIQRDASHREDVVRHLCGGISRLESLPPQALDRPGVVPLRITPRTPTETAFWVEKPLANFRLDVDESTTEQGMDRLHREAFLVYRYDDGRDERLRLGADLFHLLLELCDGFQLGDVSTDDTFAQLSIFVQRLVREDHRRARAWNPMKEDAVFDLSAVAADEDDGSQRLVIQELGGQADA